MRSLSSTVFRARPIAAVAACAAVAAIAAAMAGPAAADNDSPSCRTVQVPVTIPGVSTPGEISGDYCVPHAANGTILLAAGGGAENASYWNMPGLPEYSLMRAAQHEGYATLAIDRLGTGSSTIPSSSTLVTYDAVVSTTDQVATALRNGGAPFDQAWKTVVGVGHSLGSGTMAGVAANDPADFDAVILTGYGPAVTPQTGQLNALYQAAANTIFPQDANLDSGYMTVIPKDVGLAGSFYLPDTDQRALDAQGKYEGLLSKTELTTRPQGTAAETQGALIKVPVLLADGQQDRHYCEDNAITDPPSIGANCATQDAFYAYEHPLLANACLATSVIPNTGHALALERNAGDIDRLLLRWLDATFPDHHHAACTLTGPFPAGA
jgi:pimeloyl-ACP methyl ester carboxylesterase